MLSRSEILITKRFLFSKKTEGYVSIFSWFSIIGITLGVSAIIIVMSVMNGFRSNLTERLIGVNSHLNIYSFDEKIKNDEIDDMIEILPVFECGPSNHLGNSIHIVYLPRLIQNEYYFPACQSITNP